MRTSVILLASWMGMFFCLAITSASVVPYTPDSNTVVLYHLDETTGTTSPIIDASANSLTMNSYRSPLTGIISLEGLGTAAGPIYGDASTQLNQPYYYASASGGETALFNMATFTIEAWVKNPGQGGITEQTYPIFSHRDLVDNGNGRTIWELGVLKLSDGTPDKLSLRLPIDAANGIAFPISNSLIWEQDVWYHVVVTYDQGNNDGAGLGSDGVATFYRAKMGELQVQVGQVTGLPDAIALSPEGRIEIGTLGSNANRTFGGAIDEVRVSDIVRTNFNVDNQIVKNSSMEVPGSGNNAQSWSVSNWAGNVVDSGQDATIQQSGQYSQRIQIIDASGSSTSLHLYQVVPVKPNQLIQLKFWMRSNGDLPLVNIKLRLSGSPYTSYFSADIRPDAVWEQFTFNMTLPGTVDPTNTRLMFDLQDVSTIWVDDVTVTILPDQDPSPPLIGNQLKNGSFEVGRDRWYAKFRENGGPESAPVATENNINANIVATTVSGAPLDNKVLQFTVFDQCKVFLTSAYFPLRYGHPATLGFWLKTSAPNMYFYTYIGSGKFSNHSSQISKGFISPDTNWNYYESTFTPSLALSNVYYFQLLAVLPGDYELDAVCVNDGTTALTTPESKTYNVGWEPIDSQHPGNIFNQFETAPFNILVENDPNVSTLSLAGRVLDYQNNVIANNLALDVSLSSTGFGQGTITLPTSQLGGFKCELRQVGASTDSIPQVEIIYTVTPQLPARSDVGTSFFGGHVEFTPYNLTIADKMGLRWLRMHPPTDTKWKVIEPTQGTFNYPLAGSARAKGMGFKILGSLDTTPKFYADTQAVNDNPNGNPYFYLPGDWTAYQTYVRNTVKAFAPYIDHWEVWNEPNTSSLLVPNTLTKEQGYYQISQNTRDAILGTGLVPGPPLAVTLVGPAITNPSSSFLDNYLALDATDDSKIELDIFSFHYYNSSVQANSSTDILPTALNTIRSYTNWTGTKPMDIWHTEGGNSAESWLLTTRTPSLGNQTVENSSNTIVRIAVGLKALGLKKHFHYQEFAHPAGRLVYRDRTSSVIEANGIPGPSLAAHAAMVYFLEEASPISYNVQMEGSIKVSIARFQKGTTNIVVAWATQPISAGTVTGLLEPNMIGFDIMGNPLAVPNSANAILTMNPTYFAITKPYIPDSNTVVLYHLDETLGTTSPIVDASANSLDMNSYRSPFTDIVSLEGLGTAAGPIYGDASTQLNQPYYYASASGGETALFNLATFTIEAWVKNPGQGGITDQTYPIFSHRDLVDNGNGRTIWELGVLKLSDGTPDKLSLRLPIDAANGIAFPISNSLIWEQDVWYHVVVTYDRGNNDGAGLGSDGVATFYRGRGMFGAIRQVGQTTGLPDAIALSPEGRIEIGTLGSNANRTFGGGIDEIRVSDIVRSEYP